MNGRAVAACTVVTRSHLPFARVVAASFRAHHSDADFFVLIVDGPDSSNGHGPEPFTPVSLDELDIPNARAFAFQYDAFELTCAAKSFLLEWIRRTHGYDKLVYLDADILVLQPLHSVFEALDTSSVVLTAHLTVDVPNDGLKPTAQDILDSGVFNGGFIAVRNDAHGKDFLRWLSGRLLRESLADLSNGYFVDQRWLMLAPGLVSGVNILRKPELNVGYWSLGPGRIDRLGDVLTIDGRPIVFFHFSGVPLTPSDTISRHQTRYSLRDFPALRPLFDAYRQRVAAAGGAELTRAYGWGTFNNGIPIPPFVRRVFWRLAREAERFGDPFDTSNPMSFWNYLRGEVESGSGLSRLWYAAYHARPDLRRAFPDVLGTDREAFLEWTQLRGKLEFQIARGFDVAEPGAPPRPEAPPSAPLPTVNVFGHLASEKGVGEALRALMRALDAGAISYGVLDLPDPNSVNGAQESPVSPATAGAPINVLNVNADGLPHFASGGAGPFLTDRYNIGYWVWELSDFPRRFSSSFSYVDEVWVPSTFCLDAVSYRSPVPVVRIPYALRRAASLPESSERRRFGIPASAFVFLFMFDAHSIVERKNPFGLIRAFKAAISQLGSEALLVLKMARGTTPLSAAFHAEIGAAPIVLIDEIMSRADVTALMALCDCYVSLHRAEGFGLTMAEAMALGKPVIATGYSGNTDFMTGRNSFLVDYELRTLDQDWGPYRRGSSWAYPDEGHAAELMCQVMTHTETAARKATLGRADVLRQLSPEAVGSLIANRLAQIQDSL